MKTLAFDIDGTICRTNGSDYKNSIPIMERISHVNSLFDDGVKIMYFSARGSTSGLDLYQFTHDQLISWGCKFNTLVLGKPSFDLLIDDKAVQSDYYFYFKDLK